MLKSLALRLHIGRWFIVRFGDVDCRFYVGRRFGHQGLVVHFQAPPEVTILRCNDEGKPVDLKREVA